MNDAAFVRCRVKEAGSSFYWGMRLLPRQKREALYAIYAYCRVLDDLVDDSPDREQAEAGLAYWRRVIETRQAEDAIGREILRAQRDFALDFAELQAVIEGMEMDLVGIVAPSAVELSAYCRRVAGAVGILTVQILSTGSKAERDFAVTLGEAVQMTNILRDLTEDSGRGRLYLVREDLARHGIAPRAADLPGHPALPGLCRDIAQRTDAQYRQAKALLAQCDAQKLRPAVVMMATYWRLLQHLMAADWQMHRPVRLRKIEKAAIALGCFLRPA